MTIPHLVALAGGSRTTAAPVGWTDTLYPSKTTGLVRRQFLTRAKSVSFGENFGVTTSSRYHPNEGWQDTVRPSKTTGLVETQYPINFSAVQDVDALPSIVVDLTWELGTATGWTLTLERRTSGSWQTVNSSITAGTESYQDTGATSNTDRYRIKLNVTGAEWVEVGVLIAT